MANNLLKELQGLRDNSPAQAMDSHRQALSPKRQFLESSQANLIMTTMPQSKSLKREQKLKTRKCSQLKTYKMMK